MNNFFEVMEYKYPDKPCKPVGKCFKSDKFYYHQRENDVLFVNAKNGVIATHPVGFLEDTRHSEISLMEFSIALNTTIFNMNILSGEYK
jgi:hypothetical protein